DVLINELFTDKVRSEFLMNIRFVYDNCLSKYFTRDFLYKCNQIQYIKVSESTRLCEGEVRMFNTELIKFFGERSIETKKPVNVKSESNGDTCCALSICSQCKQDIKCDLPIDK